MTPSPNLPHHVRGYLPPKKITLEEVIDVFLGYTEDTGAYPVQIGVYPAPHIYLIRPRGDDGQFDVELQKFIASENFRGGGFYIPVAHLADRVDRQQAFLIVCDALFKQKAEENQKEKKQEGE